MHSHLFNCDHPVTDKRHAPATLILTPLAGENDHLIRFEHILVIFVCFCKHEDIHRRLSIAERHYGKGASLTCNGSHALHNASNGLLFSTISDIFKRNRKVASFHSVGIEHVARQTKTESVSFKRVERTIVPALSLFPIDDTFVFTVFIGKEASLSN